MSIKRMTPDKLELVHKEMRNWAYRSGEAKRLEYATKDWFDAVRARNTSYDLIRTLTGLNEKRLDELLHGKHTTATYWLPDGSVRKDY